MKKLWAAIVKDLRILSRDKAGLLVLFLMPVLLVVVMASIQNSTLELVNSNKVSVVICNRDGGENSIVLVEALNKIGMFTLIKADSTLNDEQLGDFMHLQEALVAVTIPAGFSQAVSAKAQVVVSKTLKNLGMEVAASNGGDTAQVTAMPELTLFYNPALQEAFRYSIQNALRSAQQMVENKQILQSLYKSMNNEKMLHESEQEMLNNQTNIKEIAVAKHGIRKIPNATQHNVPAWTVFAMFFIVVTLSTGLVKEKLSGSFIRLKTMPTNYLLALAAKQIAYIGVTFLQVVVIFSLGIFLFPHIGLPQLNLPEDISALILVSVLCGWCAVSYGVLIGIYAKTLEQAVGFGAVSVVILAALGGIIVPEFVMPEGFRMMMKLSPLHWCLEAYYELFLEGGRLKDILPCILPILGITLVIQLIAIAGLKKQRLI